MQVQTTKKSNKINPEESDSYRSSINGIIGSFCRIKDS